MEGGGGGRVAERKAVNEDLSRSVAILFSSFPPMFGKKLEREQQIISVFESRFLETK
jgi:hypothetical protein